MGKEMPPFRCVPGVESTERLVQQQQQPQQPQQQQQQPEEVEAEEVQPEEPEAADGKNHASLSAVTEEEEASQATASAGGEDVDAAEECHNNNNNNSDGCVNERLYDRDEQQQQLLEGYHRVRARLLGVPADRGDAPQQQQQQPQLFLVTGTSGMGKTTLASSIRHEVTLDGAFFVSCKFAHSLVVAQQQHQRRPLAPFVSALNQWVDQLWKYPSHQALLRRLQERIRREELTAELQTLLEEVPALRSVILPASSAAALASHDADDLQRGSSCSRGSRRRPSLGGGRAAQQAHAQFAVVLRRFIRLICSLDCEHPLVLLLDDLQWADSTSIDLLESLLNPSATTTNDYPGLMVIATCRSNEVAFQDPLSEMLRRVEDRGTRIVDIQPSNLGIPALTLMISDAMGLPLEECHAAASMVLQQTQGNVLFAQQYIQSLRQDREDGQAIMDASTHTVNSAGSANQSEDERLIRWLTRQMNRLPGDALYLLQVLSCLGGAFDTKILQSTSGLSWDVLQQSLMICVDRNYITYNADNQAGGFGHDKYQEAAYNLLSANQRPKLMLGMGQKLQQQCRKQAEFEDCTVLMVDLLLCGKDEIHNQDDRDGLALWCLEAGRRVARTSSFAGSHALDYMEHGIQLLLGRRHWRDQYDLSLALYNAAAELAYGQGNHKRVEELVKEIKENARSFMDQVQACTTSIYSIGAQCDYEEAIAVAFGMLTELGHPFPENLTQFGIRRELFRTRGMLKRVSEKDILNLPFVDDRKAMAAMNIIQMLHTIFTTSYPEYTELTGSRLVRLTLKYGFSPISTIGFSLYGATLVRMGWLQEGHAYGQLALQLMEMHQCRECESKVFLTLGVGPIFAKRPFAEAVDLMERSHTQGLETGDIETAVRATMCSSTTRMLIGNPLPEVAKAMKETIRLCDDYASPAAKGIAVPYENICQLLMGKKRHSSDHMNQFCLEAKHESVRIYKIFGFCFFAMYMSQLEFAEQLMACLRESKTKMKSLLPISQVYQLFVEGMVAAALGRKNKDKSMVRKARRRLAKLQKFKKHSPENYSNKVCLIKAELAACAGRKHLALSLYDESIEFAEQHGFVNEQALACEKAGRMLLEWGRLSDAHVYLSNSRALYKTWGAKAKLSQLDRLMQHGNANQSGGMAISVE